MVSVLICVVMAVMVACGDGQSEASSASGAQSVEDAGVTVRLLGVDYQPERTVMNLEIVVGGLVDPDIDATDILAPISSHHIETTGISGVSELSGTLRHYTAQNGTQQIDLTVGPVESHLDGATVQINTIGVLEGSGYQFIEGAWSFDLSPEEADITEWVFVDVPQRDVSLDPVFHTRVQQIRVSERGILVDYVNVRDDEEMSVMPLGLPFRMELPDGTLVEGEHRVPPGQNAGDGGALLFPHVPEGVTTFTLLFGDVIIPEQGSAEVTFTIPEDTDRGQDRVEIPLDVEFSLAEDTLRVTEFVIDNTVKPDGSRGGFVVVLHSDMPASEVNVRFVGPILDAVLVDNLGNRYGPPSGGMEFNRDERSILTPAGATGLNFREQLDPDATEFTLMTEDYGRIVRGREPMTIELPEM